MNGEKRKESANKKEKIHEKTEKGNPSAFRCYIRISAQNKMHELLNDNEWIMNIYLIYYVMKLLSYWE